MVAFLEGMEVTAHKNVLLTVVEPVMKLLEFAVNVKLEFGELHAMKPVAPVAKIMFVTSLMDIANVLMDITAQNAVTNVSKDANKFQIYAPKQMATVIHAKMVYMVNPVTKTVPLAVDQTYVTKQMDIAIFVLTVTMEMFVIEIVLKGAALVCVTD